MRLPSKRQAGIALAVVVALAAIVWTRRRRKSLDSTGTGAPPNASLATANYAWSELGRRTVGKPEPWPAPFDAPPAGWFWQAGESPSVSNLTANGKLALGAAKLGEVARAALGGQPLICYLLGQSADDKDAQLVSYISATSTPAEVRKAVKDAAKGLGVKSAAVSESSTGYDGKTYVGAMLFAKRSELEALAK